MEAEDHKKIERLRAAGARRAMRADLEPEVVGVLRAEGDDSATPKNAKENPAIRLHSHW